MAATPVTSPAGGIPRDPTRLTVAVDLDEVLGAFVESLAAWHNATHGSALTAADFHSYHFADVWGGSAEATRAKMDVFFGSDHFERLAPLEDAAATLRRLRDSHCRFVVVTSRDHVLADRTRAWLDVHYPGVFEGVLFGNHYGKTGVKA